MNEPHNKNLIDLLVKQFKFWRRTAIAFIEAEGKCVYCGEDLYSTRVRFASHNIDHLYPQSNFPQLVNEQNNVVWSCFKCNNLKRGRNLYPNPDDYDPAQMLKQHREWVINHIKERLQVEISEEVENCRRLNEVLPWK